MSSTEEDERGPLSPPSGGPRFTARALLCLRALALICFLFFTAQLAYTCATDGSPFRSSLLTPWMVTTLWDFYLIALPMLLTVLWRHRASPLTGFGLVLFICCLGSSATWLYLLLVFLSLRAGDPVARLFMGP